MDDVINLFDSCEIPSANCQHVQYEPSTVVAQVSESGMWWNCLINEFNREVDACDAGGQGVIVQDPWSHDSQH